ncbi:50S ribosomal protein L13 [Patescibacteria group bacterium]|nr:50S ribosomal protein L13 [Patescibacteria group bacterium]
MKYNNRQHHKIDATDKVAGRLASEIATMLIGKNKEDYEPNVDSGDYVEIENVAGIKFTGNKLETKKYFKHTGYIGNLKTTHLKDWLAKTPDKLLKRMVRNMLPDNRLRADRLKRLTFKK